MHLRDHKTDLLTKLRNPRFAAAYPNATLAENDPAAARGTTTHPGGVPAPNKRDPFKLSP
jgi:hypothetical protein